jgi:hypothetical protein
MKTFLWLMFAVLTCALRSQVDAQNVSVQLNGAVNPNGSSTTFHFEYGLTSGYGQSTPSVGIGSDTLLVVVSAVLTGLTPRVIYHYRLVATNAGGSANGGDEMFMLDSAKVVPVAPTVEYQLFQNYPNPFRPTTTISYNIPIGTKVKVVVYDMLGDEVRVLTDQYMTGGQHSVVFDAKNLSSGMYLYRMQTIDFASTRRLVLLK